MRSGERGNRCQEFKFKGCDVLMIKGRYVLGNYYLMETSNDWITLKVNCPNAHYAITYHVPTTANNYTLIAVLKIMVEACKSSDWRSKRGEAQEQIEKSNSDRISLSGYLVPRSTRNIQ